MKSCTILDFDPSFVLSFLHPTIISSQRLGGNERYSFIWIRYPLVLPTGTAFVPALLMAPEILR